MRASEAIGKAVKVHRERAGMTQAELSEAVKDYGVPMEPTTILRVENGARQSIRVDELLALAAVLGVTPPVLLMPTFSATLSVGPHKLTAAQVGAWMAGDLEALERTTQRIADLDVGIRQRRLVSDLVDAVERIDDALDRRDRASVIWATARAHTTLAEIVERSMTDQELRTIWDGFGLYEDQED